jgi:hypothetical protein
MAAPATAAWQFEADEDPLTDAKTGYISEGGQVVSLAFKCWEGDPNETLLVVITPLPFDASADYKSSIDVQIRADKGEVRTLSMAPKEAGGLFTLITNVHAEPDVLSILTEIGKAQKRIAIGMMDKVHTVSAAGSSKAVQRFSEQCTLPSN